MCSTERTLDRGSRASRLSETSTSGGKFGRKRARVFSATDEVTRARVPQLGRLLQRAFSGERAGEESWIERRLHELWHGTAAQTRGAETPAGECGATRVSQGEIPCGEHLVTGGVGHAE